MSTIQSAAPTMEPENEPEEFWYNIDYGAYYPMYIEFTLPEINLPGNPIEEAVSNYTPLITQNTDHMLNCLEQINNEHQKLSQHMLNGRG